MASDDMLTLVARLARSIEHGALDEAECAKVEELASTNSKVGAQVVRQIAVTELQLSRPSSLHACVEMVSRLVSAYYDVQAVSFHAWHGVVESAIRSSDPALHRGILSFVPELMRREPELLARVRDMYFVAPSPSSPLSSPRGSANVPYAEGVPVPLEPASTNLVCEIFAQYSLADKNSFVTIIHERLSTDCQRLALRMFATVVSRRASLFHDITTKPLFTALLAVLRGSECEIDVALTLGIVTMLMPVVAAHLPKFLRDLNLAFRRVLLWGVVYGSQKREAAASPLSPPLPPSSLRNPLCYYFHHLYGMFPCSCVAFLREQSLHDPTFSLLLKPLLVGLRLSPLVISSVQEETSLDRWKGVTPDQVVAQCISIRELPPAVQSPEWYKGFEYVAERIKGTAPPESGESIVESGVRSSSGTETLFASLPDPRERILSVQREIEAELLDTQTPSSDHPELHSAIIANELLFEKYLRQQYLYRFGHQLHISHSAAQSSKERDALQAKCAQQADIIEGLEKKLKEGMEERETERAQFHKITAGLERRIELLNTELNKFGQENERYERQCRENEVLIDELRCSREKSIDEVGGSEPMELRKLREEALEAAQLKKAMSAMTLQQWQALLHENGRLRRSVDVLEHAAEEVQRNQSRLSNLERGESTQFPVRTWKQCLSAAEEKYTALHKDYVGATAALREAKQTLEQAHQMHEVKMKLVEEKYLCAKAINVRLEQRICELLDASPQQSGTPSGGT